MKKKRFICSLGIGVISLFVCVSVAYAATERDITIKKLGGKIGDLFKINGGLIVNSLQVKGLTSLVGAVVNPTANKPVVVADDLRVDGRVWRGATAGSGDNKPFIIKDDAEINGNLSVSGNLAVTGTIPAAKQKLYSGTIDLTANGDEMVTTAEGSCVVPTGVKNYTVHFKKISVPEIDITNMPTVRVFTKPIASPVPPGALPNSGDVWSAASYVYLTQNYVYLGYKYVSNLCNGTTQTGVNLMASGDYRLLVVYQ